MDKLCLAGLITFISLSAIRADGEAVIIKSYKPKVGDRIHEKSVESTKTVIILKITSETKREERTSKLTLDFIDKVLETGNQLKPTKFERTFTKTDYELEGKDQKYDLVNETVLVVKKGDKYEFLLRNSALPVAISSVLFNSMNKKDTDDSFDKFFPNNAVKSGDTWKLDLETIAKEMSYDKMEVDVKKSTGSGLLKNLSKSGDSIFGTAEINIELVITKFAEIAVKDGDRFKIKFTMEGCLDGSQPTMSTSLSVKGLLKIDNPKVISIEEDTMMQATRELVKK